MVSRDSCVALPRVAMGLSAVSDCGIPDHTHLLFWGNGVSIMFSGQILAHDSFAAKAQQKC